MRVAAGGLFSCQVRSTTVGRLPAGLELMVDKPTSCRKFILLLIVLLYTSQRKQILCEFHLKLVIRDLKDFEILDILFIIMQLLLDGNTKKR